MICKMDSVSARPARRRQSDTRPDRVRRDGQRARGSAIGGFNLAGSLGFAIGPIIGAWAYTVRGFGFAFVVVGVLEMLLAVVGTLVVLRWRARERGAEGS